MIFNIIADMNRVKQVLKTSEFGGWNDGSGGKKSEKTPFAKKKFHARPFFSEPFAAYCDFINDFATDLFNEYSNLGNNNIINSKL
jgi:hypothetical protein